ncbi:MAG: glycoside hydrolase family 55 protein [Desulfobacterales bacterium]|nr:glycoside hydrolase family 55 protein [Desulfobacterales bacterium]
MTFCERHKKTIVQKSKLLVVLLISACALSLMGINVSYGEIISPDRLINWSPGIPGGIPNYPVSIDVKDAPYNAKGDGVTDDTAAIQNAINDCAKGYAVFIPEGIYRLTSQLSIFRKGIVLRGAGPDKTFLKNESTSGSIIRIYSYSGSTKANVIGGYTKGSTTITVDNSSSFRVGDHVTIDQKNDPNVTASLLSYMKRAIGQVVKITGKTGVDLTINRPLYYTYNADMNIMITKLFGYGGPVIGAGIEDLYVERVNPGGYDNINFISAINCWVRNVKSYMARKWHVRLRQSYGCEVRDSYFQDGHNHGGDASYGVGCFQKCTDNLIENNIFYRLRHSMILEYGGCGNVFGYNYSKDPINENGDNTDWLMSDMSLHGGHPYMNLFEGNIAAHIDMDNYLGSSSHNTFFRNHIERKSIPTVKYGLWAVEIQKNNLYENVVGNVLCTPGATGAVWRIGRDRLTKTTDPRVAATLLRHGNYDYISGSTQWDSNISDHNLPNSYYLDSKPSFFGDLPWPMIGPDLDPKVGILPAKKRFDDMQSGIPSP